MRRARETYLDALFAAIVVHRLATGGGGLRDVAEAALAVRPASDPPRAPGLLLDSWVLLITKGSPASTPTLKRALSAFRSESISQYDEVRWLWLACHTAYELWDDQAWLAFSERLVELGREVGALTELPILSARGGRYSRFTGWFALRAPLTTLLAKATGMAATEVFDPLDALARVAPDLAAWAPLLAPVWGLTLDDTHETAHFDEAFRAGKLRALLVDLLCRLVPGPTLWVLEENERARRFYEIAGMRPDGARKVEVFEGAALPHVRYALPLAPPAR